MSKFRDFLAQEAFQISLSQVSYLAQSLLYLLGINQTHLDDYATTPQDRAAIKQSIGWSLRQGQELKKLNIGDQGQLTRNAESIVRFAGLVLKTLGPIYQQHLPPDKVPAAFSHVDRTCRAIVAGK